MHLFARLSRRSPVRVVLYTRQGCGLCEKMKETMARARVRYVLEEVDVDRARALKKRYGLRLPVLAIEGEECFEGRLEPADFRRAVRARRRPRAPEGS